ncbi:MAG TPA: hypothetical protein VNO35_03435 [Steroidobacteraceae bacterium]|nr:hypothetical protein [Steroidobacteraceae bacterium]
MAATPVLRPARRWALLLLGIFVLATVSVASVPAWRHALLRSIGWALVAQDDLAKADIIVVSSDSLGAGMLEAADLVKAGFAPRVAIFDRPQTPLQRELLRRRAPPYDPRAFAIRVLQSQGVSDFVKLAAVMGTTDEGRVLQQWCAANSIHSVIFVSVSDHSRRTRRVLDRALGRHGVKVIVRYTHWSEFDPDTWWQNRDGQRIQIEESEKLLVDILRHPF